MSTETQKCSIKMAAGHEVVGRGNQVEIAPGVFGDIEELKRSVEAAEATGAKAIFFPEAEARVSFTMPNGERVE
jgi:hypothetical protein